MISHDRILEFSLAGLASIHLLAPSLEAQVPLHHWSGWGSNMGWSIASGYDLDGDGVDDVVVAAAGSLTAFSGADGGALFTIDSPSPSSQFAEEVDLIGDLDGDGRAEIVVSDWTYDDPGTTFLRGAVWVVTASANPSTLFFQKGPGWGWLGTSVSAAGDVNADGYEDFVVGEPGTGMHPYWFGQAWVLSGAPPVPPTGWPAPGLGYDGPAPAVLHILEACCPSSTGEEWDSFGYSVSGAGDTDGDGYADVVVGSPVTRDPLATDDGAVHVFSGLTGALRWTVEGDAGELLGFCVSDAGDVDGDGYADVIVGGPGWSAGLGRARILSGVDGALLHTFTGEPGLPGLGRTVDRAGDLDGDGVEDLLAGAEGLGLRAYSGADGTPLYTFSADEEDRGTAMRDLDGDGRGEILVGALHAYPSWAALYTSSALSSTLEIAGVSGTASVLEGERIELHVDALGGSGFYTYQWRKDGLPLVDDSRIQGASTATLSIDAAVLGDAGTHTVEVTDLWTTRASAGFAVTVSCGVSTPWTLAQPAKMDLAGKQVALDGVWAAAAAPYRDEGGVNSGAVALFQQTAGVWTQTQEIVGLSNGDIFGSAVALEGGVLAVGAAYDDIAATDAGSVRVFELDGSGIWNETATLTSPTPGYRDFFGWSVARSGEWIIVGEPYDDQVAPDAGCVHFFLRNWAGSWTEEDSFVGGDTAAGDLMGFSVAARGDLLAVGAPGHDAMGADVGAGYVFRVDDFLWSEEAKLTVGTVAPGGRLGDSVAVDAERVLIGARLDDPQGTDSGSAHVFVRANQGTPFAPVWSWQPEAQLMGSGVGALDHFGRSVALRGSVAIVGAPHLDTARGGNRGAAFYFRHDGAGWIEDTVLAASDGLNGDGLGWSVALDGTMVLTGAPLRDDPLPSAGAFYAFDLLGCAP